VAIKVNASRIAHILTPTPGPATWIEAVSWKREPGSAKPGCFINRNRTIPPAPMAKQRVGRRLSPLPGQP